MKSPPVCSAASLAPERAVFSRPHPGWAFLSQLQVGQKDLYGCQVLKEVAICAKVAHLVHYSYWTHWVGPDGYRLHGL